MDSFVDSSSIDDDLTAQLRFERILSDIASRFVVICWEQMDEAIVEAQRTICGALGIDRSAVLIDCNGNKISAAYSWNRPEIAKFPPVSQHDDYPWETEIIRKRQSIHFSSLTELPPEASEDVKTHRRNGLRSHACFPLMAGGTVFGALAFGVHREERQWSQQLLNRLRLIADVFAGALARKLVEKRLQEQLTEIEMLKEQLEKDNVYLRKEIQLIYENEEIVGESEALKQVMVLGEQVAPMDTSVLIHGETGTGKELMARAIHKMSRRRDHLMVTVNCASLPPSLIESELFGREKGAYTGALTMMTGRFEMANESSLFLDEIGELPIEVQSKLLRVLETGQFERLGSSRTIKTDIRLIAATNRDLEEEVKKGKFRKDLYYRLNVFPIKIPPLRRRTEDIIHLVWYFVREYERKMNKRIDHISKKSIETMMKYSWPGNIRELRNVIERAMIISSGTLKISLPESMPEISKCKEAEPFAMKELERSHILKILENTRWRISGKNGAAEILGMKRTTLNSKMKALNIRRPTFNSSYASSLS